MTLDKLRAQLRHDLDKGFTTASSAYKLADIQMLFDELDDTEEAWNGAYVAMCEAKKDLLCPGGRMKYMFEGLETAGYILFSIFGISLVLVVLGIGIAIGKMLS